MGRALQGFDEVLVNRLDLTLISVVSVRKIVLLY